MSNKIVEQFLGLDRMIIYEYASIPETSLAGEARTALAATGRGFDRAKSDAQCRFIA